MVREVERRTAREILGEGRTPEKLHELVGNAQTWGEEMAEAFRKKWPQRIDCRAGCSFCCHMQTHLKAPEAIAIADFLLRTLSAEELTALTAHVEATAATTRTLNATAHWTKRVPCALLDRETGLCRAYAVRPLTCRSHTSTDVANCREDRLVQTRAAEREAFGGILLGLGDGLREEGLDSTPLELNAALAVALREPDVAARYLAGEPVFAAAAARHDPGLAERQVRLSLLADGDGDGAH